jgi:hypothetical protein
VKSQDILLLFKMTSLHVQDEIREQTQNSNILPPPRRDVTSAMRSTDPGWGQFSAASSEWDGPSLEEWEGWSSPLQEPSIDSRADCYSLRALSASLSLSKSEVSNALARCREAGLLSNDFETSLPTVNRRALLGIAEHALKYFFPVKLGAIVRGIPTGFGAPALSSHLKSAGDLIPVWPDPLGKERGQAIEPLYKSVPDAVKQDRTLYHYLALADAIRVGGPRETAVAINLLKAGLGL